MAYVGELSSKKLRKKMGETLNESASAPTSAFAQRQLEKMGWTKGTGLGKKGTGRTSHIRVTKRNDQEGLGVAKADLEREGGGYNNEWWKDNVGSTLARLSSSSSLDKKKKDKKKKKKSSKTQPIKEYTDDELFQATGGARFGMRAQRRAEGKWKRTESNLDEDTAKGRVEWNGLGSAKLLLANNESSSKKKRQREDDTNNDPKETTTMIITEGSTGASESNMSQEDADQNGEEMTREKKRRKKEKKKQRNEAPENNDVIVEKKKKKKKDKK
eukprot:scaffold73687_cov36-Attheya_sp.AAC.1